MARTGTSGDSENPTQASGRVLPHDLEVEKAVLSALLLDNQAIHSVLTEVKPEDFYHPAHQQLYRAMLVLQDENEPVDLHTLSDYLNTRKLLDTLGGPVFLAEIAEWGWPDAPARRLLHRSDVPRQPQPLPRYLPPDADRRLAEALAAAPPASRLAADACLLQRACGLRVAKFSSFPAPIVGGASTLFESRGMMTRG